MRRYQTMLLFARHGRVITAGLTTAAILADLYAVLTLAIGWLLFAILLAVCVLFGLAMLVFVDLVRVIADMMVPQSD